MPKLIDESNRSDIMEKNPTVKQTLEFMRGPRLVSTYNPIKLLSSYVQKDKLPESLGLGARCTPREQEL